MKNKKREGERGRLFVQGNFRVCMHARTQKNREIGTDWSRKERGVSLSAECMLSLSFACNL